MLASDTERSAPTIQPPPRGYISNAKKGFVLIKTVQILSINFLGGEAYMFLSAPSETGCTNRTLLACRQMLPSGLERGEPYFKSPLIGHPILPVGNESDDAVRF